MTFLCAFTGLFTGLPLLAFVAVSRVKAIPYNHI